jgi:RND family efflux transporter MFP subunit
MKPLHVVACAAAIAALGVAQPILAEQARPRPVISEVLRSEDARLPSFPGVIAAGVESELSFQTTGRVAVRTVELGDRVAEGDVLASLDQISLAEDVETARAALDAARAQGALAEQNLQRAEQLTKRGVSAESQLESAIAERDSSAASIIAAEANLASAEDAERYGVLRAPSDGVVIKISVEPGTMVAPGTLVLTLAFDNALDVTVNVPPETLALIPAEAAFLIHPRVFGAAPVKGRLRLIEPVANTTTRSRRLRIRLDGKSPLIRIGSLVEVGQLAPGRWAKRCRQLPDRSGGSTPRRVRLNRSRWSLVRRSASGSWSPRV